MHIANLFPDLVQRTQRFLNSHLLVRKIRKGEQFLWEGDALEGIFVLFRGYAKVFHVSKDGREQVLAILRRGEWINTVPALRGQEKNQAHAVALTDLEVGVLSSADYRRALHHLPDFANLLLYDFAAKLEHITRLVEELSLFSARQRLIRFLLRNVQKEEKISGFTQDEIAAQIGTVRDVVSRLLGMLAREGLIRVERQRIFILDENRLQKELED